MFYLLLLPLFISTHILQCIVLSFRSPCNLNASIGRQAAVPYSAGIHVFAPVAVDLQSKLTWRLNAFLKNQTEKISFQYFIMIIKRWKYDAYLYMVHIRKNELQKTS